jgi:hypothetical protein
VPPAGVGEVLEPPGGEGMVMPSTGVDEVLELATSIGGGVAPSWLVVEPSADAGVGGGSLELAAGAVEVMCRLLVEPPGDTGVAESPSCVGGSLELAAGAVEVMCRLLVEPPGDTGVAESPA